MSDENLNTNQNAEQNSEKLKEIAEMYQPKLKPQAQPNTGTVKMLPEMSPIGYYVIALQKYVQFNGRSTKQSIGAFI